MSGLRRDRPAIMKRASEEEGNDGAIRFLPALRHCEQRRRFLRQLRSAVDGTRCRIAAGHADGSDSGSDHPQGYLDQDGRPIDLSQMAQDFPPDEPHRRGISKKTITVIAALVVVLIVVSAVCGWMIWSNRQRGSQLSACQSAVSSVKASRARRNRSMKPLKNFPKPVRRSWTMHRCLRILPMPSGRRSRSQPMTMSATRPMVRLGCALSESRPARI